MSDKHDDHGHKPGATNAGISGNKNVVPNNADINDPSRAVHVVFSTDSNPNLYPPQQARGGEAVPISTLHPSNISAMLASGNVYAQTQPLLSQLATGNLSASFAHIPILNRAVTPWNSYPRTNAIPGNGQNPASFVSSFTNQLSANQQSPQYNQFNNRPIQNAQLQTRLPPTGQPIQNPQIPSSYIPINSVLSSTPTSQLLTNIQNPAMMSQPFPQTATMYNNVFYPALQQQALPVLSSQQYEDGQHHQHHHHGTATSQQPQQNIPLTRSHTSATLQQAIAANGGTRLQSSSSSSSAVDGQSVATGTNTTDAINNIISNGGTMTSSSSTDGATTNSTRNATSPAWHNDSHQSTRDDLQEEISRILRDRRTNPDTSWLTKLPLMAKKLEQTLYDCAASFEHYCDKQTLRFRLHQIAQRMQPRGGRGAMPPVMPAAADGGGQRVDVKAVNLDSSSSSSEAMNGNNNSVMMIDQGTQPPAMLRRASSSSSSERLLNTDSAINAEASVNLPVITSDGMTTTGGSMAGLPDASSSSVAESKTSNASSSSSDTAAAVVTSSSSSTGQPFPPLRMSEHVLAMFAQRRAELTEDDKKQLIRQERHRLLLLRHASKCTFEAQQCPTHPLCYKMKSLWKHICDCKLPQCATPHCNSSRTALSHYGRCTEPLCAICAPVKQAIHDRQRMNEKNLEKFTRDKKTATQAIQVLKLDQLDPISCRLYALDEADINIHIESLRLGLFITSSAVKSKCMDLVNKLMLTANSHYFKEPVDPVVLGIPEYSLIVKNPMDLGTVRKRLDNGSYRDYDEVRYDIQLTFDNALLFNQARSPVHSIAKEMKKEFERQWKLLWKEITADFSAPTKDNNICFMCGKLELNYEPPIYYCNGPCGGTKIKRSNVFYQSPGGNYHYCVPCYGIMKESTILDTPGEAITTKSRLMKKKNEEKAEEAWVQCSECEAWCHMACTLFNNRRNFDEGFPYLCHDCLSKKRLQQSSSSSSESSSSSSTSIANNSTNDPSNSTTRPKASLKGANELPETKLSKFIQHRVTQKLKEEFQNKQADSPNHREEAGFVTSAPDPFQYPVFVRQMLATDKPQTVRQAIIQRYSETYCRQMNGLLAEEDDRGNSILADLNLSDAERGLLSPLFVTYPEEFLCRVKCISLFQNQNGIDVLLFVMYCYEYSHKSPQPNHRRVYVSYLDSCHYFQPRQYRTVVYHEILVAYLEYCKNHGFHTAHIWACPPAKGDDYILHVHPQDQKTPLDARLQKWYLTMLDEARRRRVVNTITTMHDVYFKSLKECRNTSNGVDHYEYNDASVLPYFEGDYWIGEADKMISSMPEGNRGWVNDFVGPDAVLAAASGYSSYAHDKQLHEESKTLDSSSSLVAATGGDKKNKRKSKVPAVPVGRAKAGGSRPHIPRAVTSLTDNSNTSEMKAYEGLPVAVRDPIMVNLSKTIEGMKEAFLVVHLLSPEFANEQWRRRIVELRVAQVDKFRQARGTYHHHHHAGTGGRSSSSGKSHNSRASSSSKLKSEAVHPTNSVTGGKDQEYSPDVDNIDGNTDDDVLRECKFEGLDQISAMIQLKAETDEQRRVHAQQQQEEDDAFVQMAESAASSPDAAGMLLMNPSSRTPVFGDDVESDAPSDKDDDDGSGEAALNAKRKFVEEPSVATTTSDVKKRSKTRSSTGTASTARGGRRSGVDNGSTVDDDNNEDDGEVAAGSTRKLRQRTPAKSTAMNVVDDDDDDDESDQDDDDEDEVAAARTVDNDDDDEEEEEVDKKSKKKKKPQQQKRKTSSSAKTSASAPTTKTKRSSKPDAGDALHQDKRSRIEAETSDPIPLVHTSSTISVETASLDLPPAMTDEQIVALIEKGDSMEGKPVPSRAPSSSSSRVALKRDETEDSDDDMENEFFDTRQEFLTLCQGNHYQFDQLRRAKHATMLVLYHLHNPDAPKYLPSCHVCHKSIIGVRWHCVEHKDCDICNNCVYLKCIENGVRFEKDSAMSAPPRTIMYSFIHCHRLTQQWVGEKSSSSSNVAQSSDSSSGAQHRQSREMAKKYMILLNHTVNCKDPTCALPNCLKMKTLLHHIAVCDVGLRKGCPMCKKCFNLLQLHARQCRNTDCNVPRCAEIKLHCRQLMAHQQAMDDRRRAKMNEMLLTMQGNQPEQNG